MGLAAIAVIIAGATACSGSSVTTAQHVATEARAAVACAAAEAALVEYVKPIAGQRDKLATSAMARPEGLSEDWLLQQQAAGVPRSGWRRAGWFGIDLPASPPSRDAAAALAVSLPSNAASCPQVRAAATRAKIDVVAEPWDHAVRNGGLDGATIYQLSLPTLSPRGDEALVQINSGSGALAASGGVMLLRREKNGAWRVTGRKMLWFS